MVLEQVHRVGAGLCKDMKPRLQPFGILWQLVISTALGASAVWFIVWRSLQLVRSRLDVGRQKLARQLSALMGDPCHLLEKVSLAQSDHEGLEHLQMLKTEQVLLQSENTRLEREKQKLQQEYHLLMGQHQEHVRQFGQVEQEEQLPQVEGNISHRTQELETYRKQAKYLQEELDRTTHFYQQQIISAEKKAHHSELAAWIAERNLSYLRRQNARNAQRLTEKDLKFKLLFKKDPYALGDGSDRAFARKHCPNGPLALGQPSPQMRPSHVEKKGPLMPSPLVPVGGGRGSRSPRDPLDGMTREERRGSSSERFADPQRAPLETGPLSPPWEQAHRMKIPVRGPFVPVDPRSQFIRRGPFPPPPPPGNMYGAPGEYFPPGPPPPPFPVQNVYSPRCFPPRYLPPKAGFLPTRTPTPTPIPTPAF